MLSPSFGGVGAGGRAGAQRLASQKNLGAKDGGCAPAAHTSLRTKPSLQNPPQPLPKPSKTPATAARLQLQVAQVQRVQLLQGFVGRLGRVAAAAAAAALGPALLQHDAQPHDQRLRVVVGVDAVQEVVVLARDTRRQRLLRCCRCWSAREGGGFGGVGGWDLRGGERQNPPTPLNPKPLTSNPKPPPPLHPPEPPTPPNPQQPLPRTAISSFLSIIISLLSSSRSSQGDRRDRSPSAPRE